VKIISVARELSTIKEERKEQNCFGVEITGSEVTNSKTDIVSLPGQNGFQSTIIIITVIIIVVIFCDIYRYALNDKACNKLLGNKP
jgi:hypothetical protein